jgi:hypothetical protein
VSDASGWARYRDPESFKWFLLGHIVFEDYMMLWEVFAEAEMVYAERSAGEQGARAAAALRELLLDGFVSLFRVGDPSELQTAADAPASHLQQSEIESILLADDWRSFAGSADARAVHVTATAGGDAAARTPPAHIRAMWSLPTHFDFSRRAGDGAVVATSS